MFLSKGYKGNYYLYYEDETTGKRRKVSTGTKFKSEAKMFMVSFLKEVKPNSMEKPRSLHTISSVKNEVLQYAKTNFSKRRLSFMIIRLEKCSR